MNEYLDFAKRIALHAGEIMLKYFDADVSLREKADKTIVTIADEEINHMVIAEVEKAYPEHAIFGEEESSSRISEYTWVCDPIDGTVPYSKGIPVSVFSLALVQDGRPLVGVVYDPFMKRMYSAIKGQGAFCNDRPIQVSGAGLERHSVIDIEWWPEAEYNIDTPLHTLSEQSKVYVLHLGSVVQGCCLVASGQYVACIFPGTVGKAVDMAAIKVIVEEAGGKVTDLFGDEQRYDGDVKGAIISNGVVHEELTSVLRNVRSA